MYLRMLKRDIKDKPGLNIVTFIFMVAAVTFMVIGSTLLYSLFIGEQKTYEKCRSSDVYLISDQSIADKEGLIRNLTKDINDKPIITSCKYDETVMLSFTSIELISEPPLLLKDTVYFCTGVLVGVLVGALVGALVGTLVGVFVGTVVGLTVV